MARSLLQAKPNQLSRAQTRDVKGGRRRTNQGASPYLFGTLAASLQAQAWNKRACVRGGIG